MKANIAKAITVCALSGMGLAVTSSAVSAHGGEASLVRSTDTYRFDYCGYGGYCP